MYEDMHTVNPCPRCGKKGVKEFGSGKWDVKDNLKQWVKPD